MAIQLDQGANRWRMYLEGAGAQQVSISENLITGMFIIEGRVRSKHFRTLEFPQMEAAVRSAISWVQQEVLLNRAKDNVLGLGNVAGAGTSADA